ncbi:FAM184 family like protein [Aduncisulcus paluster]|uniref:FAM184 family like protein n=1 Tax=Aduncisulcus paluster TaxID=2918883 RepID=A0ABQ5KIG8_9EUKA|nr:FAM184 family like protein [Aduncisulcus paluster]
MSDSRITYLLSKKVAQLTKVVYQLNTRNEDHDADLDSLASAYEAQIDQIMTDAASKISRYKEEVERRKKVVIAADKFSSIIAQHDKEKEEFETRLQEVQKRASENLLQMKKMANKRLLELQQRVDSLDGSYKSALDQSAMLTKENGSLKAKVTELDASLSMMTDAKDKYQSQAAQFEEELRQSIINFNKKFDEQERKYTSEIELLRDALGKSSLNEDKQQKEIESLKDMLVVAQGKISDLEQSLSDGSSQMQDKISNLQHELGLKEEKIRLMRTNFDKLQKKYDDLKRELSMEKDDLQSRLQLAQGKISDLEQSLSDGSSQMQDKISNLQHELGLKEEKIRLMRTNFDKLQKKYDDLKRELSMEKDDLQSRLQRSLADLGSATSLLDERRKEIKELDIKINQYARERNESESRAIRSERELASATKELETLRQSEYDLQQELGELKRQYVEEKASVDRLQASLAEAKKRIDSLESDLRERGQMSGEKERELLATNERLLEECDQMKSTIKSLKERNSQLESDAKAEEDRRVQVSSLLTDVLTSTSGLVSSINEQIDSVTAQEETMSSDMAKVPEKYESGSMAMGGSPDLSSLTSEQKKNVLTIIESSLSSCQERGLGARKEEEAVYSKILDGLSEKVHHSKTHSSVSTPRGHTDIMNEQEKGQYDSIFGISSNILLTFQSLSKLFSLRAFKNNAFETLLDEHCDNIIKSEILRAEHAKLLKRIEDLELSSAQTSSSIQQELKQVKIDLEEERKGRALERTQFDRIKTELEAKITELEQSIAASTDKISSLSSSLSELEEDKTKLVAVNSDLQRQIEVLTDKCSKLAAKTEEYEEYISRLKDDEAKHLKDHGTVEEERRKALDRIKELEEQLRKSNKERDDLSNLLQRTKESLETLEGDRLREREFEISERDRINREWLAKEEAWKTEKEQFLKDHYEEMKKRDTIEHDLRTQLSQLETEYSNMKRDMEESMSDSKLHRERLEREKQEEIDRLKRHYEQLITQLNDKHDSILSQTKEELETRIRQLQRDKEKVDVEMEKVSNDLSLTRSRLADTNETVESLKRRLADVERESMQKQQEHADLLERTIIKMRKDMDRQRDDFEAEIRKCEKEHELEISSLLKQYKEGRESLNARIEALRAELAEHAEKWRKRSSLPEDVERIRNLEQALAMKDGEMRKIAEEKEYFRLELIGREEMYNKVFSSGKPTVAVFDPASRTPSQSSFAHSSRATAAARAQVQRSGTRTTSGRPKIAGRSSADGAKGSGRGLPPIQAGMKRSSSGGRAGYKY